MELMHNQLFKLLEAEGGTYSAGLYRTILNERGMGKIVAVQLDAPKEKTGRRCGRPRLEKTLRPRKKPRQPLVGDLLWMASDELQMLEKANLLIPVELERDPVCFRPLINMQRQKEHERRIVAMAGFLNFTRLEEGILTHHGLAGLVSEAVTTAGVSRAFVYEQWSKLARLGINELSLYPRQDLSGARGGRRPCSPGGRRKAGPKTLAEQIAKDFGTPIAPLQPGMTHAWEDLMLAADRQIKSPKLSARARYQHVLQSAFVRKFQQVGQEIVPIELAKGSYPNFAQFKWLITTRKSLIERVRQNTTQGHFDRSLRGLKGKNWEGSPGPGYCWAIDSTIGDIYLRSSIDRAWIIGRPIVYIIVDVWSTAIVGFHVCLAGPSWDTAKISLFNAVMPTQLKNSLFGCEASLALNPHPTLCFQLMCDRGEYLSIAARQTLLKLIGCGSYAPPYRPDLKGLVEVIHRIVKDQQFPFTPGAIDFRRKEYELRRVRMEDSAYTLHDYIMHLEVIFDRYNLTSDRSNRLDAHMIGAGVYPSPAGLWRYGHQVGLGFSRATPMADLIHNLLPETTARVKKDGVHVGGLLYEAPQLDGLDWTARARIQKHFEVPARFYPGSVSRVWTPHPIDKGFLELHISDQANASQELRFDEIADAFAYQKLKRSEQEHLRINYVQESMQKEEQIRKNAIEATRESTGRAKGESPPVTLAREFEKSLGANKFATTSNPSMPPSFDHSEDDHLEIIRGLMEAANRHEN